jgi:hypothetical protein
MECLIGEMRRQHRLCQGSHGGESIGQSIAKLVFEIGLHAGWFDCFVLADGSHTVRRLQCRDATAKQSTLAALWAAVLRFFSVLAEGVNRPRWTPLE